MEEPGRRDSRLRRGRRRRLGRGHGRHHRLLVARHKDAVPAAAAAPLGRVPPDQVGEALRPTHGAPATSPFLRQGSGWQFNSTDFGSKIARAPEGGSELLAPKMSKLAY